MELREQLINAITDSVVEMNTSLFSLMPAVNEATVDPVSFGNRKIMASVGLAGRLDGSLVIIFDKDSACKVVSQMLNIVIMDINSDVVDGVGEIANILAGGIKRKLENLNYSFDISLPLVISGGEDPAVIARLGNTDLIEMNVECSSFKFYVILNFKLNACRNKPELTDGSKANSQQANDLLGRLINQDDK